MKKQEVSKEKFNLPTNADVAEMVILILGNIKEAKEVAYQIGLIVGQTERYYKHQISLLKQQSDKRLIEEVEKAIMSDWRPFEEDKEKYINSIKARLGITQ